MSRTVQQIPLPIGLGVIKYGVLVSGDAESTLPGQSQQSQKSVMAMQVQTKSTGAEASHNRTVAKGYTCDASTEIVDPRAHDPRSVASTSSKGSRGRLSQDVKDRLIVIERKVAMLAELLHSNPFCL